MTSETTSPEENSTEEVEVSPLRIGRKHLRVTELADRVNPATAEYRKMRKRQQNRESEARARARKKQIAFQLSQRIKELLAENTRLTEDASALRAESVILQRNLAFYRALAATKSQTSL